MIEPVLMGRPPWGLGAAAFLATVLLLAACGGEAGRSPMFGEATLVFETDSGEVRLRAEVAATADERSRGLMFREELAPDAGMVFLHEVARNRSFWMKDTLIPLSLAVWGADGKIAAILDMEPCREDPCPIYDPGVPWIAGVEVNQGFFEQHGIEVGDRVRLEG